jgi:cobalamin biosynthesis protein CobD/CbiB
VSGTILGATTVAVFAAGGGICGFSIFSEYDNFDLDAYTLSKAAKRARQVLEEGSGGFKKTTLRERVKFGVVAVVPCLFNFGVLMVLVLGILTLFQQYEGVWWKIFVTALALGIKIAGSRLNSFCTNLLAPNLPSPRSQTRRCSGCSGD